jgi:hypothetical protein
MSGRWYAAALLTLATFPLSAQQRFEVMAHGILAARRADPAPDRTPDTEAYLTQPTVSVRANLAARLAATLTLNFESVTLARGELTPGAWGEGFVDRRHPHTTVHELLLTTGDLLGHHDGPLRVGVVVGKGFVPFGTDDPMARPFLSYPVNHHFAQILERAVAILQVQRGPFTIEASLFNGDEPERPGQWPLIYNDSIWRFGDSWSARVFVSPMDALELQLSAASVHSPEHRPGAGGEHDKLSASARWHDRDARGERYAMIEWARTSELDGFFVFHSLLAEGSLRRGRLIGSYRFERTERPEEERLADQYRSLRPHIENSILGTLRWTLHTMRVGLDLGALPGTTRLEPFVEVTLGGIAQVGGGIADPVGLYGTTSVRHLSAGFVLSWQARHHRMGRYGVLSPSAGMHH